MTTKEKIKEYALSNSILNMKKISFKNIAVIVIIILLIILNYRLYKKDDEIKNNLIASYRIGYLGAINDINSKKLDMSNPNSILNRLDYRLDYRLNEYAIIINLCNELNVYKH